MRNFIIGIAVVSLVLVGAAVLLSRPEKPKYSNLDEFAQCLADKEITMYGAAWCSHCKNEKIAFGQAFAKVPYVECPDNPKLCADKGVTGYPTWVWPDGKKLQGRQGLEKLSAESGCDLKPI